MGASEAVFPAYDESAWRRAAEAALKGASFDRLVSHSADGFPIKPIYASGDGPRPLSREGDWAVVARVDHPDAGEANARAAEDLTGGADGLQIVFRAAVGSYGFGLRRSDSATLHRVFDGIRFDSGAGFELDLGPDGPAEALAFAGLIERTGARPAEARVSFGLDPFAAAALGPYPADGAAHMRPFVEAALALKTRGFAGPVAIADARLVHAAGGTPAQELGFALAAGVSLLRAFGEARTPLEAARAQIAFRLAADADEFMTLSKFRALRLLWSRVEEACGLAPRKCRVQAETAWRMMTARDPYVNVMRAAMAAFSAGLGGADSVSVLPHSLAATCPDGLARRLARNGQLILLRESHLGFVADPTAGAGAFEALTQALCEKGWATFQAIEAAGGLAAALASGAFPREAAASAETLARDVARTVTPITGVSAHPNLAEVPLAATPGAPAPETVARADGAMCPIRLAEPFEALRAESDARLSAAGARPRVYLVALGPEPAHRRRVAFMREWLEAGGIEPVYDGQATTPEKAAERFVASQAEFACLCGEDASYAEHGQAYAATVRRRNARSVLIAGRPGANEAELRSAGIDEFVFAGGDAVMALQQLHRLAKAG